MSDPVAEAAAQIAAQQADPTFLERTMDTIHDLEQKVEHLIHPDAPQEAGTAAPGESAQSSPASTTSTMLDPSSAELPNVAAATPPAGAATPVSTEGDLPNAASAVAAPTAEPVSASNAAGASTTLPTAASSAEPTPLHARIAEHLEAIYTLARDHSIATETAATRAAATTKTHVGDILHRISNGMAVTEGELVQKLEALYRML